MAVAQYKAEFIQRALDNGVLLFGEFTLKSGR
jgi:orotate phosphoribosyltransferase